MPILQGLLEPGQRKSQIPTALEQRRAGDIGSLSCAIPCDWIQAELKEIFKEWSGGHGDTVGDVVVSL